MLAVLTLMQASAVGVLWQSLCRLHNWNGEWLSIRDGEYVFTSCCGLCCLWKLKCGDLLTCCDLSLLCSSASYCISLRSFTVSFLKVKKSLLQVFNLRVETVLDLQWGNGVHPEMWKSSTSSSGTDLKLDTQHWWWRQQLVVV